MQNEDFSMKELSYMMYQINEVKAEGVIQFMGDRYEERMDLVSKLIMILIRNGFNMKELAKVALNLRDEFKVDLGEVFNDDYNSKSAEYFANLLIREGIQKEAFSNSNQSMFTGELYAPKKLSKVIGAIREDDLDVFLQAIRFPISPMQYRKNMEYLFWSALFNAVKIFKLLLQFCTPDETVIKIAIKKGNTKILKMIFETKGVFPHRYMKYIIMYHRNYFFDNLMTPSNFNEELLDVARDNLNFHAYSALSLDGMEKNNSFANI
jgi:hypothetical protein